MIKLSKCIRCNKDIPSDIKSCPYCRARQDDVSNEIDAQNNSENRNCIKESPSNHQTDENNSNRSIKAIIIVIIAIVLIFTINRLGNMNSGVINSNKNIKSEAQEHSTEDIWIWSMYIIENSLKAPATAEFCNYPEYTVSRLKSGDIICSGYVDSENGFGALIRTEFEIVFISGDLDDYEVSYD